MTPESSASQVRRCAIYTRKSTTVGLEMDFNSLDAQREACERYIQNQAVLGWKVIAEKYDDGGFTGANLERPAFKKLMEDIEARKIDIVVVYKVDRLSRSLLDFAKVMERFDAFGAAFVSVTQNFSTADAMGRLTLNLLISFAEFERSMIAERTRDKIAASRRKGKWTGGPAPLGYNVVDRKLVVNPAEAELVRYIFNLYVTKRSAVAVAHTLNAENRPTKHQVTKAGRNRGAKEWDKNSVLHILRSPVQVGLMPYKGEVHPGEHEAVLDRGVFEHVQALLDAGCKDRKRWGRNPNYLLTGLLHCARCGAAFTPASTRKGKTTYRYYRCVSRDKKGAEACEARPLPASAIESFVVEQVRGALADGTLAADITEEARARLGRLRQALHAERAQLPGQIAATSTEGKRLVETVATTSGAGRRLVDSKLQETGDQLGRLERRLSEVHRRLAHLDQVELEVSWVASCLTTFDKVWETMTPDNRGRLVRAVIKRVEVDEPENKVKAVLADFNDSVAGVLTGMAEAA